MRCPNLKESKEKIKSFLSLTLVVIHAAGFKKCADEADSEVIIRQIKGVEKTRTWGTMLCSVLVCLTVSERSQRTYHDQK
jgi:hypothetical protein